MSPRDDVDILAAPLGLARLEPDDRGSRMLGTLQSNILHPHVRGHLRLLAVQFGTPRDARRAIATIARDMKPAARQLDELHAHRRGGADGSAFVCIGLSATGYERLGIPRARWPDDPAFLDGMRARDLADPPVQAWQKEYRRRIDAIVVVGSQGHALTHARLREVSETFGSAISVVAQETGRTLTNANGDAIEHFGYVDGRSQPLFLDEDLDHERATGDGVGRFDPLVPLGEVLVADPGVEGSDHCYGSYLVYRKLEQNVRAFKKQERRIARKLRLDDAERAGALVVGRFEDGTPVVLSAKDGMGNPVPNDFTYAGDPDGARCPSSAHIRRMNGRAGERTVIARRGTGYGVRADDPEDDDLASKPKRGVGLLFMGMVARIEEQFESLQHAANGDDGGPFDAITGQRRDDARKPELALRRRYGDAAATPRPVGVRPVVTLRGGEYVFLPSIEFLVGLGAL